MAAVQRLKQTPVLAHRTSALPDFTRQTEVKNLEGLPKKEAARPFLSSVVGQGCEQRGGFEGLSRWGAIQSEV